MPHCARLHQANCALHADHRPRLAVRSRVRENLAALDGKPESARRRFRPGVVQANTPRRPRARYLGPEVPAEELIWQDPIPAVKHPLIDAQDIASLKSKILASGLPVSQLVSTAWASASTFRGSDKRGGANDARVRLCSAEGWEVLTSPLNWRRCLRTPEGIQSAFKIAQSAGKKVSLADLIVLAGCVGVEQAAKNAGHAVTVPFSCRDAPTPRRSKPMWNPSPCWNLSRMVSAITSKANTPFRPRRSWLIRKLLTPPRPNDGARGGHARHKYQFRPNSTRRKLPSTRRHSRTTSS